MASRCWRFLCDAEPAWDREAFLFLCCIVVVVLGSLPVGAFLCTQDENARLPVCTRDSWPELWLVGLAPTIFGCLLFAIAYVCPVAVVALWRIARARLAAVDTRRTLDERECA